MKILPIAAVVLAGFGAVPVAASTVTAVWTGTVSGDPSKDVTITYVYDTAVGGNCSLPPGGSGTYVDCVYGGTAFWVPSVETDPLVYVKIDIGGSVTTLSGDYYSLLQADDYSFGAGIENYENYAYDDYGTVVYSFVTSDGGAVPVSITDPYSSTSLSGPLTFGSCYYQSGLPVACFDIEALTISVDGIGPVAPVPLPASALFLTGALTGLGGLRRWGKRKAA